MVIWEVTGEATTDSTGGVETWFYVTPDEVTLPDVKQTFRRRREWYRITSITLAHVFHGPFGLDKEGL